MAMLAPLPARVPPPPTEHHAAPSLGHSARAAGALTAAAAAAVASSIGAPAVNNLTLDSNPSAATPSNTAALHESLAILGLVPVPNSGDGDCFWHAVQPWTRASPASARRSLSQWLEQRVAHPARSQGDLLAGCFTGEWHVQATVEAWPNCFPHGLLFLHAPTGRVIRFHAHHQPVTCSLLDIFAWPATLRSAPCILYTEAAGENQPGHFERLVPLMAPEKPLCAHSRKPQQSCLREDRNNRGVVPCMQGDMLQDAGSSASGDIPAAQCSPPCHAEQLILQMYTQTKVAT
eukprot:s1655_g4.t1